MSAPLDAEASDAVRGGPSFSLRHRAYRALWAVVWRLLGAWTPAPLHRWRRLLLRCFGARIAPTARVYGSASIWYPANLTMLDHAVLGPRANCYCMGRVEIGRFATISQGAHLCGGTHDIDDPHHQLITRPIAIGDRAWIAAEAFVGPGVVVGEGAVLGARGVAMRSLDPWTVYGGNPARALRERARIGRDG